MTRLKIFFALVIVFLLIMSLSACSPSKETADTTASAFTVTDFLGRKVTIQKTPERIISLSPSTTELIFELGLRDKVVGVTDFDDYPEEVASLPKVGGFNGPNLEAIMAQQPDIIFASSLSGKEQMESIQKLGFPVVVLEAKNIAQIYDAIEWIGKITGTEQKSSALMNKIKNKIDEISNKVKDLPPLNTFYVVDTNGNYTAGKGTFIDEIIQLAGGKNIADDAEGWVQYSLEQLVAKNPDVIITSAHAGDIHNLKNMAGYKDTNAVKNDKIFIISDDNIIVRASHRIVMGLEEIAKYLHPEAFE